MKKVYHLKLSALLLTSVFFSPTYADEGNISDVATYLQNLGTYLGYDLTATPPTPTPQAPASPLSNITLSQLMSGGGAQLPFFTNVFNAFLGSITVNSSFTTFVPNNNSVYSLINGFANSTFQGGDSGSASIWLNGKIDQETYQKDPVSQAILNILATPNYTYCMDPNSGKTWTGGPGGSSSYPDCVYKYNLQIMTSVLGGLPSNGGSSGGTTGGNNSTPPGFFSYDYNKEFLSQLNGDTLISPLLYTTTPGPNEPKSSSSLLGQTQMQQAADFIRYASGSVIPVSLPQQLDYQALFIKATNSGGGVSVADQAIAQATLTSFFTKLRVYAAQMSVAYSNLYYMFSKRMPQNTGSQEPTSQALNEFTMASWRLYTPSGDANKQWLNQINQAPTATVQKEIATLLAEINYQLYLTRQQQERLLLTNTMLLLLTSRSTQPNAGDFTTNIQQQDNQ